MSTDWERYSTPEESRARSSVPSDNGVVALNAGSVRLAGLQVLHTPDVERGNRAHTDVIGEKTNRVRLLLHDLAEWKITISNE
jgi:hypothetical protein